MADATRQFAITFVDELIRNGIRHAVVAPGSRSTPIALAFAERPEIDLHIRIDERSASFLALGIAKASRTPVPVLCTSGTAAAEFHPAVLEADQSAIPLLVFTADRPPELRGIGANQTIDQIKLYGDAVRWFCEVGVPEDREGSEIHWRSLVSQAVNECRHGPVHLNLPMREPLVSTDRETRYSSSRPASWTAPAVPGHLGGFGYGEQIGDPERGVLVLGDIFGSDPKRAIQRVTELGWPVIAEPHSGARWEGVSLRCSDALLADRAFTDEYKPDLVIVCGRVGLSRTLLKWLSENRHIVVSPDHRWRDVTRTAEVVLRRRGLESLGRIQAQPADAAWLAAWQSADHRVAAAMDFILDEGDQLSEPRVARDIADLIPEGAALVVANSMPIRDLDLVMRPRQLTIYANRGVSGIDGFVSTAMGVAIARSRQDTGPTYALTGDLSLLHDINGLMPGPSQRPDITFVVINNDGGGIFSTLPVADAVDAETFEKLWGTPHGMDLSRIAAAYECQHTEVTTAGELKTALEPRPGVRIIEVKTDRAENAALHRRLREAAAVAVASG